MKTCFIYITEPFNIFFYYYKEILSLSNPFKTFFLLCSGLIVGWWLYVPVHELLHAAGCIIGGGEVGQLEIKPIYGGNILSRFFSFVVSESYYAGRLSGFDTHGSDWTYGMTIYFPFTLSLFGFLFLDLAVRKKACFFFASLLPLTFAPLISLTGDFFELGSLFLFQIWAGPSEINRWLISDDIFRLLKDLHSGAIGIPLSYSSFSYMLVSFLTGSFLAWGTIMLSTGFRAVVIHYIKGWNGGAI